METIRVQRAGRVIRVTIDHPRSDLNAVDATLHHDLRTLFAWLRTVDDAGAVLLTGAGRAFCAGGDFDWFPQLREPGRAEALRLEAKQMITDLVDCEVPVVCALNGHAMGLGASIALLCDVILASSEATIGDPHVRVGLVAGDGGAAIWPILVGAVRAKRYLLTGDPVPAAEAERIGLVNAVCAPDDLDDEAMAMANRIAALPPLAVRYTKASVNKWVKQALDAVFDTSTALELITMRSADHAEAVDAIRTKRKPVFKGE